MFSVHESWGEAKTHTLIVLNSGGFVLKGDDGFVGKKELKNERG